MKEKVKNKTLLSYFGFGRIFSGRKKKQLTKLLGDQEREIDVKSIKKSREAKREGEDIYKLKGEDDGDVENLSEGHKDEVKDDPENKIKAAENSTAENEANEEENIEVEKAADDND